MAGREVVQADDPLIETEQRLEQVGANEAGHASDEPGFRAFGQVEADFFVACHGVAWMVRHSGPVARIAACAAPTRINAAWWFFCRSGASREVLGDVGFDCSRLAPLLQGGGGAGG